MTRSKRFPALILLLIILVMLTACVTTSTKTVQLSQITQDQAVDLQKSHVQFIQRYYEKLREEVTVFLETKWIPLFLSKAVNNPMFRKDLDKAYLLANIKGSDLHVTWKGTPLVEPQKSAIQSSIKRMVTEERGRLGEVLLDFAEAAQTQINAIRKELLNPINNQERMVVDEINAAWADLLAGQAVITAHLESVVEVKRSQDEALKKLGVIEKRDKILDTLMQYNDKFTNLLEGKENAEDIIQKYKDKFKELEEKLKGMTNNP